MSNAEWSADGSGLPSIDPHTKAKHQIIEEYITNLIHTLYGKARYGVNTFTFIDGFCGGGMYYDRDNKTTWEGSPIRLIKAVRAGYERSKREYSLNIKFIFIDSKKAHLDCLKNYSLPQAGMENLVDGKEHIINKGNYIEQCEFILGEFEDSIDECILKADVRKGHSLFILDPFGWTDVSMKSIRKINSLKKSEIIYTYMINFIKRFLTQRDSNSKRAAFQETLEADGYYDLARLEKLDTCGEQSYLRNESMRLFRDKGKSKYVFTFSMIPKGGTLVLYYLIHISKNLTALEVIKESFWKKNNLDYQYHFEIYGQGFKSADFYEQNQISLRFNITQDSHEFCLRKLDQELGNFIYNYEEGIPFRYMCDQTMELNPASRSHYEQYINQLRADKSIEILRKDEIVRGKKVILQRNDIIRPTSVKQLSLLN